MLLPTEATLLARHGALWMFLVTLGERLGLPVFISPLLLAAGAMVAVNPLQFWLVLFATAVPCLLGDALWYELGRRQGRRVIAAMCRISFVPDSLEQKAYADWTASRAPRCSMPSGFRAWPIWLLRWRVPRACRACASTSTTALAL